MPGVEFEDSGPIVPTYTSRAVLGAPVKPSMIEVVKKLRMAKTDGQAYYMLLGFAIIAFLAAGTITYRYIIAPSNGPKRIQVSPEVFSKLPPEVQANIRSINSRAK